MRLAGLFGALAIAAGGFTVTTLPRPPFPRAGWQMYAPSAFAIVSSRRVGVSLAEPKTVDESGTFRGLPAQAAFDTANRRFVVYGKDGSTGRYLVAYDRGGHALYGFDFASYGWPPRIGPGEREFVYEQPVWAQEAGGVLYVENTHSTYARSSYGQNAYVTAIDLRTRRAIWRSAPLVANAQTFLLTPRYVISGYGFTDERDYLYALDRKTGHRVGILPLPNAPEQISRQGSLIRVRTYDHVVVVRVKGG